jgi:hypothetical protein
MNWTAWAFWGIPAQEMVHPSDRDQLERMICELEHACSSPSAQDFKFSSSGVLSRGNSAVEVRESEDRIVSGFANMIGFASMRLTLPA